MIDFSQARAPDGMRLYAIGDVHGCAELLAAMHQAIEAEIARDRPADWRIIHLGDYCDRGPDTKGVLEMLVTRHADDPRVMSLCGNHDEGMLNFLDARGDWRLFVHNGGVETCASYGVTADFTSDPATDATRERLRRAMPSTHRDFLAGLPHRMVFGDYFFCHAGIRPGVPLKNQTREDLLWIRGDFHRHSGLYEKVIVHGHTPVDAVDIRPNRVNLDTRAFATGVLSGLAMEQAEKRVLEISVPR